MPDIDFRRRHDEPQWKANLRNIDAAFAEAANLVPFCAIGLIVSILMITAGFTIVRPAAPFPPERLAAKPAAPARAVGPATAPARADRAPGSGEKLSAVSGFAARPGELSPGGG